MEPRIKRVYKPLPPHTYEAHPLAHRGEASKPLIIAIIAIVAVVVLSLLLLFSDQLVGKAFFTGQVNSAGAELVAPTKGGYVYENQHFSLKVRANTDGKANNIAFTLQLPAGVTCEMMGEVQSLLPSAWSAIENTCVNGLVSYTTFSITESAGGGSFDIAQMDFKSLPIGGYIFDFQSFWIPDSNNQNMVVTIIDPGFEVLTAPYCGDTIVNDISEQCDDGNILDTDLCSNGCTLTVCGDGNVQALNGNNQVELCDDGNTATESCAYGQEVCQVCSSICQLASGTGSFCGDGTTDASNGEQCDDGNIISGDGCSSTCQSEVSVSLCGNGMIDVGEECDDANDVEEDGCFGCILEGPSYPGVEWSCSGEPTVCVTSTCTSGECCTTNADCTTGKVCQETYCQTKICEPNMNTCSGNNWYVCNQWGTGATTTQGQCTGGQMCQNGACVAAPVICEAGVQTCLDADTWQTCNQYGSGYNVFQDCSGGQVCQNGACVAETVELQSSVGTKITLTDVATSGDTFATKITATETFTTEVTVYTILYGANNKVLSIKSEKIETGLTNGQSYTATVNYPATNVVKKSVLVFDVEQSPTVFGQLQVDQ